MDSAGGERPREPPGEDELGTGRGLEGDEVFLEPDIGLDYRALPVHVLCSCAKAEQGYHLNIFGESERYVSLSS